MTRDLDALVAYLAARASMPFAWGSNDCFTLPAGAIKAQTGVDVLAGVPAWASEAEALAILAARGGIKAAVDAVLQPIAPALAKRGDVVAIKTPEGSSMDLSLAVVEGHTLLAPGANRVRRLPRRLAVLAWSAEPQSLEQSLEPEILKP